MVERPEERTLAAERRREAMRVSRRGIGTRLGQMFDTVVNEPVPGHWLSLLKLADERAADTERRASH